MNTIRPVEASDQDFLWDMLFEMVYVPESEEKPGKEALLHLPAIAKYLNGFGLKSTDSGFVAENENRQPIGAAWFRLFDSADKGYGYVDENTPELCIAVLKEYRGLGIGSMLLKALIDKAKFHGLPSISLSVDSRNAAIRLYFREGFKSVGCSGTSITMKLDFVNQSGQQ